MSPIISAAQTRKIITLNSAPSRLYSANSDTSSALANLSASLNLPSNAVSNGAKALSTSNATPSAAKFEDIKTFDEVHDAIEKGLIESVEITNVNDYTTNQYQAFSYEVKITAKNEKGFLPWQKVEKTVYVGNRGEAAMRDFETYCRQHGVKAQTMPFNQSMRDAKDLGGKMLLVATPFVIGLIGLKTAKAYKMFEFRSSLPGYYRDSFGNGKVIDFSNTRDNLLGYSEEIYAHLDQVGMLCNSFSDSSATHKAMNTSGSALLTGPPGTGKTYLADLAVNSMLQKAKAAGKKVYVIDLSQIAKDYAGAKGQLISFVGAQPNSADIAREILQDAERKGAQMIFIRADDPNVSANQEEAEIAANWLAGFAKDLRDLASNAQNSGCKVSQSKKGFFNWVKSSIGFKEQPEKTSIEGIHFWTSTNAEGMKKLKEGTSSQQALGDRVGPSIWVGTMEMQARYKFVQTHLQDALGVAPPENFVRFICALTASDDDKKGLSIRDYTEAGNLISYIKQKIGTDVAKMNEIGRDFDTWVKDTFHEMRTLSSCKDFVHTMLKTISLKSSRAEFEKFDDLSDPSKQALFIQYWKQCPTTA